MFKVIKEKPPEYWKNAGEIYGFYRLEELEKSLASYNKDGNYIKLFQLLKKKNPRLVSEEIVQNFVLEAKLKIKFNEIEKNHHILVEYPPYSKYISLSAQLIFQNQKMSPFSQKISPNEHENVFCQTPTQEDHLGYKLELKNNSPSLRKDILINAYINVKNHFLIGDGTKTPFWQKTIEIVNTHESVIEPLPIIVIPGKMEFKIIIMLENDGLKIIRYYNIAIKTLPRVST